MRRSWRLFGAVFFVAALAAGALAWWLKPYLPVSNQSPQIPSSSKGSFTAKNTWDVLAKRPEVTGNYNVKRQMDLIGFHFTHLENLKTPQQVIIAENVPPASAQLLFTQDMNLELINMVSNQLLALRKRQKPETLAVQKIIPLSEAPLSFRGHSLKQRQVSVIIQLSSEPKPREYRATLIQYPQLASGSDAPLPEGPQTVLVTFSKPAKFQDAIATQLLTLDNISLKPQAQASAKP